jgi:moderate conductance mechanosensitive channel
MHWLNSYHRLQSEIRFLLISVFTFIVVFGWTFIGWSPPAYSQLPSFPTAANDPMRPPGEVTRRGEYEMSAVKSPLDGKVLFLVASPTIFNRDKPPEDKVPVEIRTQEISERLRRVIERSVESKKTPSVSIAKLNNRLVLQISDDQSSRPVRLVTITEPDSDFSGKTPEELAKEWQGILQTEVGRIKYFSSPEVLSERFSLAGKILLVLLLASGLIWFAHRLLTRREKTLEVLYQQELKAAAQTEKEQRSVAIREQFDTSSEEEAEAKQIADLRSQFLANMQQQFTLKRRLEFDRFFKWLLFWIFILIWYIGIYYIMSQLPILMRWSGYVLTTPLFLILVWFGISLANRLSASLIDRLIYEWKVNPYIPSGEVQRIDLRARTISGAIKGFSTFILVAAGIIWSLGFFNVPTNSILAGGAVIALAISFGSQSLIKDLVNGCLILLEDQFAVGDVIQIGDKNGLVENLNLRVTQLRNSQGQLITIPNSSITNVNNLTRLWSRVDLSILVAYENSPQQVIDVLKDVSRQFYCESRWQDCLLEPPEVLGIDDLSKNGMLMRVWIKTMPMEQWRVAREFRFRVRQAFEANGVKI